MSSGGFRYQPDEWAHDLDQWWVPLAGLAAQAGHSSATWKGVLGVEEFFDERLLGQPRVLTPWLCLASAAVAAAAARAWAEAAPRRGQRVSQAPAAGELAATTFALAVALEEYRWGGGRLGESITSTAELAEIGRAALAARGHAAAASTASVALHLVAGWLARSGGEIPLPLPGGSQRTAGQQGRFSAQQAVARIAEPCLHAGALTCGTAHLVERLAAGVLEVRIESRRPDDPPTQAWANVLLVADRGQVGVFAARRQRSLLAVPARTPVPDLARMAFIHASEDFLGSVTDAFTAAHSVVPLRHDAGLISWSLQLPAAQHPLAERTVSGRSAGLGAYVAFRSLSQLDVFAPKEAAFTGQVFPDGDVGAVGEAHEKIGAAGRSGVRLVVHPGSQEWRDPEGVVEVRAVGRAEDAVLAVTQQLDGLRGYLEAACQLAAPEPWLQTWLEKQGRDADHIPLLTVMCRHLRLPSGHLPEHSDAADLAGPTSASPAGRPAPDADGNEPEIPPCPAHLLASSYPDYSFAVSAEPGGGITIAAKRMVAEAARQALDCLRALGGERSPAGFTLPLYAPLSEPPANWDELIRVSVEALPAFTERSLEIAAALANVLRTDNVGRWQPMVVVDGADRARRGSSGSSRDREREFIALVAGAATERATWRPGRPAQVVLCGRNGSPSHLRAAEALRHERRGGVATMGLDPLTETEINRFAAALPGGSAALTGVGRELAASPLLLTLSVIAGSGGGPAADASPADLFDRGIDVLLGQATADRRFLAEIAFRAAFARKVPAGEFSLSDLAATEFKQAVEAAQAKRDEERIWAMAMGPEERDAFQRAAEDSHLLTASGTGWRFFHDRAFAFLVADRIARHAAEDRSQDEGLFGMLGPHLADPLWTDVIESIGRLLELHAPVPGVHV